VPLFVGQQVDVYVQAIAPQSDREARVAASGDAGTK
jgi:hypothetical protein